jgi:hypothetical protein
VARNHRFDVAGCTDEEILEFDFGKTAITASAQAMASDQFADGAFDGPATAGLAQAFFELWSLLLEVASILRTGAKLRTGR